MSSSSASVEVIIQGSRNEQGVRNELSAPPLSSEESLIRIAQGQLRMEQIRQQLTAVIERGEPEPSRLTQAVNYWGEIPAGLRVFAGLAIPASFFILGVITHIGVLFTLSIISALVYCACTMYFDEHWTINNQARGHIATMIPLADLLSGAIGSLHEAHSQLSSDIAGFRSTVTYLEQQLATLDETSGSLAKTNEELLERTREFAQIESSMTTQMQQLKGIARGANEYAKRMLELSTAEGADREAARVRLVDFFNEGSRAFSDYALRFNEVQGQLVVVQQQLAQQVEFNRILARRNEATADRFEDNARRGEATVNEIKRLMGGYIHQSSMSMFGHPRVPRVLITHGSSQLFEITDSSDSSSDCKELPMSRAVVVRSATATATVAAAPAADSPAASPH